MKNPASDLPKWRAESFVSAENLLQFNDGGPNGTAGQWPIIQVSSEVQGGNLPMFAYALLTNGICVQSVTFYLIYINSITF